jgi:hypothetical protein
MHVPSRHRLVSRFNHATLGVLVEEALVTCGPSLGCYLSLCRQCVIFMFTSIEVYLRHVRRSGYVSAIHIRSLVILMP